MTKRTTLQAVLLSGILAAAMVFSACGGIEGDGFDPPVDDNAVGQKEQKASNCTWIWWTHVYANGHTGCWVRRCFYPCYYIDTYTGHFNYQDTVYMVCGYNWEDTPPPHDLPGSGGGTGPFVK